MATGGKSGVHDVYGSVGTAKMALAAMKASGELKENIVTSSYVDDTILDDTILEAIRTLWTHDPRTTAKKWQPGMSGTKPKPRVWPKGISEELKAECMKPDDDLPDGSMRPNPPFSSAYLRLRAIEDINNCKDRAKFEEETGVPDSLRMVTNDTLVKFLNLDQDGEDFLVEFRAVASIVLNKK